MNRTLVIIAIVVSVVAASLAAYSYDLGDTPATDNQDLKVDVTVDVPGIQTNMTGSMVIPLNVTASNNKFAIDFYREVIKTDSENIFFSPSSMYVAFSMLYEGAKGQTKAEIADVFGFNPDRAPRHNDVADTMSSINRDDPHATLEMANSMWLADWFKVADDYRDVIRNIYLADIETVDFVNNKKESIGRINEWADENTHGLITEVLRPNDPDINALTTLVLANAIYFKGTWITEFPKDATDASKFWKDATNHVEADFMHVNGMFNYNEYDGVQVLRMPYKGDRLSMLVVLPAERNGLEQLEQKISAGLIEEWNRNLHDKEVIVSIPKFKMETDYALNNYLTNLGMETTFVPNAADLSGMFDAGDKLKLYVSKALQKAFVDVNEEGTEAAAVTVIVVGDEGEQPVYNLFRADHPFLFMIQDDESGAILFMGRVLEPMS